MESYQRQLDSFKLTLGLPPDARLELDRGELDTLVKALGAMIPSVPSDTVAEEVPAADAPIELVPPGMGNPGRYELDESAALVTALQNRLDLRVAVGRVHDAQRTVAVAADQLRADITLLGSGSAGARRTLGSVSQDDSILRPDEGSYSALLTIDLPFERTAERNTYRMSLIRFEQAVRDVQALEDQIKLEVRNGLSRLLEARESILIQAEAVKVAQRRVASTNLFLEAGRAEIRDVLEAQDALVTAQNALTAALVSYRVNELSLQRDLDVLLVDERGLWQEYDPAEWTD
ncbi:MAG: TolC family protein [Planctomycetota bacterium]